MIPVDTFIASNRAIKPQRHPSAPKRMPAIEPTCSVPRDPESGLRRLICAVIVKAVSEEGPDWLHSDDGREWTDLLKEEHAL